MRQEPPSKLIELLERTGLATAGQVRGVRGRAKRLARGLPLFESVWVDALAQARIITRFQAVRIDSGQADALRVGPYLLERSLPSAGYVDYYQAREVESGGAFRLAIIEDCRNRPDNLLRRLESLLSDSGRMACENLSQLVRTGEKRRAGLGGLEPSCGVVGGRLDGSQRSLPSRGGARNRPADAPWPDRTGDGGALPR